MEQGAVTLCHFAKMLWQNTGKRLPLLYREQGANHLGT
jgi:hypothetical protein